MRSIRDDMEEFRGLIAKGSIQNAYRALLSYIMGLRSHFQANLVDSKVSGLYQGYMDMTYFAIFPPSLRQRNLKIALVFNFNEFRFEAWLSGRNRSVQRKYWELFKDGHWPEYRVSTPAKGVDSILEYDLVSDFDLDDPAALTSIIETAIVAFIDDIERFLSGHPPLEQPESSD